MSIMNSRCLPYVFFDKFFNDGVLKEFERVVSSAKSCFAYPFDVYYTYNEGSNKDEKILDSVVFSFALAGFKKHEFKIKLMPNELTLTVDPDEILRDENTEYYIKGISRKSSTFRCSLSADFDIKNYKASFENGMLWISLPAKKEKYIEVKID